MNRLLFFLGCIICATGSHSQPCTDASAKTAPGKWIIFDGATKTPQEKMILASLKQTIRNNFKWQPAGGDIRLASYSDEGFFTIQPGSPAKVSYPYSGTLTFLHFFCSAGKLLHEEVSNLFSIRFNALPFAFDHTFYIAPPNATDADTAPESDAYAVLNWLPEVKDGYFEYIDDGEDGTGTRPGTIRRMRVLTKPGKLPYTVLTKKDYYEKSRKQHLAEIESYKAAKVRIAKELKDMADGPKMAEQMDQMIAIYQGYLDKINKNLQTRTAEELSEPAYGGEENGDYFWTRQAENYKRPYIIQINRSYFNASLPAYSPQVITLLHRYGMGKDELGNQEYSEPPFHQALQDMKIFDLLTEKLGPLIGR